jgi:tRNA modification GTPase
MYSLNDTIVAVGSAASDHRVIIRISGPAAIETCWRLCGPDISIDKRNKNNCIIRTSAAIDNELRIDVQLYLFFSPHSYTGQDVAEIHIFTNPSVISALFDRLLAMGLRPAGPGEFTARAYLNGKMDLTQAEAVNEIIVSSNTYQLKTAQKLLSGRLSQTIEKTRSSILEILSLIEAGLDFSEENIEFISNKAAAERLEGIKEKLEDLLAGSISYESIIDLPSVGIAGAPNAGKSSLVNRLLGTERSIVSDIHKTTRDVLTDILELKHCNCVLFDCAGLLSEPGDIIDELSQQATVETLQNSTIVIFCIDTSKSSSEGAETACATSCTPYHTGNVHTCNKLHTLCDTGFQPVYKSRPGWSCHDLWKRPHLHTNVIPVATKCDLLSEKDLKSRLEKLKKLFGTAFEPISSKTGAGIDNLKRIIDEKLTAEFNNGQTGAAVLNARHKQAVNTAIENFSEAVCELQNGNDETAAMLLRSTYRSLCETGQSEGGHIDEQILDQIFGKFCIGK